MAVRMSGRALAAVGGWLLAAAAATGAGMFAVGAIGDDISPESARPLSDAEVAARANTAPGTSTTAPATSTGATTGSAVLASRGGTVLARCAGREVRIVNATPAQGFRVDERDDGLEDTAEVKFTGAGTEVKVEVHCVDGMPRKVEEKASAHDDSGDSGSSADSGDTTGDTEAPDDDHDDHGGDRHGGSGSSGGSGGSDDGGHGGHGGHGGDDG